MVPTLRASITSGCSRSIGKVASMGWLIKSETHIRKISNFIRILLYLISVYVFRLKLLCQLFADNTFTHTLTSRRVQRLKAVPFNFSVSLHLGSSEMGCPVRVAILCPLYKSMEEGRRAVRIHCIKPSTKTPASTHRVMGTALALFTSQRPSLLRLP